MQDGKLCDTGLPHLRENSAEKGAMEGWPSGLRRTPGKRVGVKAPPGFESPSLRHTLSNPQPQQYANITIGILKPFVA